MSRPGPGSTTKRCALSARKAGRHTDPCIKRINTEADEEHNHRKPQLHPKRPPGHSQARQAPNHNFAYPVGVAVPVQAHSSPIVLAAPNPCEQVPGLGWRSHRVATPVGRPRGGACELDNGSRGKWPPVALAACE